MNKKQYEEMRTKFIEDTFKLSDSKRIEYTEGNHNDNVLWNFDSISSNLGIAPIEVLSVYLSKHISSLFSYFKTRKTYSEPIEGRVQDIINYLILMVAMIERDKKKSWNIKDRMVKTSDDDTPENR
jgi:hypothetical protein|tara:strand:+ start:5129 stop:5506 length:378 start_codon:yes stop_codon:yes gene_type:complete